MLKFVLISALVVCCTAYGSGGYGGSGSGPISRGLGGATLGGRSGGPGQVVSAAIQTRHSVEYRDVPSTGAVNPTVVEVNSNSLPVNIVFRSASSSLNIQQVHDGAQGSSQETSSEDEPHRLVHSVTKPIIQEVREVITPFRKITQEIQPVQEEVLTIVARANEQSTDPSRALTAGPRTTSSAAPSALLGNSLSRPVSKLTSTSTLGRPLTTSPLSGSKGPSFSSLRTTKSGY